MASLPKGFYREELNRSVWEVPERYKDLNAIGTGAYGQVWYGNFFVFKNYHSCVQKLTVKHFHSQSFFLSTFKGLVAILL